MRPQCDVPWMSCSVAEVTTGLPIKYTSVPVNGYSPNADHMYHALIVPVMTIKSLIFVSNNFNEPLQFVNQLIASKLKLSSQRLCKWEA